MKCIIGNARRVHLPQVKRCKAAKWNTYGDDNRAAWKGDNNERMKKNPERLCLMRMVPMTTQPQEHKMV